MSATEEPQQSSESGTDSNKEFLQYIRERDQARELAAEKEKECNAAKGRSYELMKKVEELEEQVFIVTACRLQLQIGDRNTRLCYT